MGRSVHRVEQRTVAVDAVGVDAGVVARGVPAHGRAVRPRELGEDSGGALGGVSSPAFTLADSLGSLSLSATSSAVTW